MLSLSLLRTVHPIQRIEGQANGHPHPKPHIGQPAQAANQVHLQRGLEGGMVAKAIGGSGVGRASSNTRAASPTAALLQGEGR